MSKDSARKRANAKTSRTLSGVTASASEHPDHRILSELSERVRDQNKMLESLDFKRGKDGWDKLSIVGKLLSSLVLAAFGLWLTTNYQKNDIALRSLLQDQQIREEGHRARISELELVAKLLPALGSPDPSQSVRAHLMIKALGNSKLMAILALGDATSTRTSSEWSKGDMVMPESDQVKLKAGSNVIAMIADIEWPAAVEKVEGQWLLIDDGGTSM